VITLAVNSERLEAALALAARRLANTRPLVAKLGKTLEVRLRAHFLERDREGNRRGWPRKHFWNREVRQNTALVAVSESTAVVAVASPAFAHKLEGGTLRPKRGRALAIPLTAEAYAKGSPREWDPADRALLFRPKGTRILAVPKPGGDGFEPMFALEGAVTQEKDPRALPDRTAMADELGAVAEAHVARQVEGLQA